MTSNFIKYIIAVYGMLNINYADAQTKDTVPNTNSPVVAPKLDDRNPELNKPYSTPTPLHTDPLDQNRTNPNYRPMTNPNPAQQNETPSYNKADSVMPL